MIRVVGYLQTHVGIAFNIPEDLQRAYFTLMIAPAELSVIGRVLGFRISHPSLTYFTLCIQI